LGLVRVFPATEYERFIGDLGPDILADDWDNHGKVEALRRIVAQPQRPIGTALLDQTNLVGIGNEYRAEVCFLAGLHPASRVSVRDPGYCTPHHVGE